MQPDAHDATAARASGGSAGFILATASTASVSSCIHVRGITSAITAAAVTTSSRSSNVSVFSRAAASAAQIQRFPYIKAYIKPLYRSLSLFRTLPINFASALISSPCFCMAFATHL